VDRYASYPDPHMKSHELYVHVPFMSFYQTELGRMLESKRLGVESEPFDQPTKRVPPDVDRVKRHLPGRG
jgi:hypothetical protein